MSILFQPCCSNLAGSALLQGIMDLCQMALFNAESSIRSQIAPDRIYRHELFSPGCSIFCPSSVLRLQFVFCIFQVAPFSVPAVYASSIICMVSLRCIIALFYELLMEVSNPAQSQEKVQKFVQVHYPVHLTPENCLASTFIVGNFASALPSSAPTYSNSRRRKIVQVH